MPAVADFEKERFDFTMRAWLASCRSARSRISQPVSDSEVREFRLSYSISSINFAMPLRHLGTISAIARFESTLTKQQVASVLSAFEFEYEDGEYALNEPLAEEFASIIDLRFQEMKREGHRMVHSLKAETGAGWANYSNWRYELVCEAVVDSNDLDAAIALFRDLEIGAQFDEKLTISTRTFLKEKFPHSLFSDVEAVFNIGS